MKRIILYGVLTLVIALALTPAVTGQSPMRIFGTSSTGASVPIGATSGALNVSINGGAPTGLTSITFATGGAIRTGTTAGNTVLFQGYNTSGTPAYNTLGTITAVNGTPTIAFPVLTGQTSITFTGDAITDAGAGLSVSQGLHVGGTSDPGDNNLLVDGTVSVTGESYFGGGADAGAYAVQSTGDIYSTATVRALRYYANAVNNAEMFSSATQLLNSNNAQSIMSLTSTWNTTGAPVGIKYTITDTASDAASLAMQILGGASGTTNLFSVNKSGNVTAGGTLTVSGASTSLGATPAAGGGLRMSDGESIGWRSQTTNWVGMRITSAASPAVQFNGGTVYPQDYQFYTAAATGLRVEAAGATTVTGTLTVSGTGVFINGAAASTSYALRAAQNAASQNGIVLQAFGGSPDLTFTRTRGASYIAHTIVQDGDALGRVGAQGSDGTDFQDAAKIIFAVDGTPGAGDMPGRIVFQVSPDGSGTPAEALRISQDKSALFSGDIVKQGANAQKITVSQATVVCTIATDTNCTGKGTATIAVTNAIPAGSMVIGVTVRVTTILAGSDGIASWELGHAGDTDAWGAALALAANTTNSIANFTVTSPGYFTAATDVKLTGTGGKIIDSGVVRITVHYISLTAATS